MENMLCQSVVLALKDPRALQGVWTRIPEIWNDLHNPYSMRYDRLIGDGRAALISGCLAAVTLDVLIDEAGACGERARIRIVGEVRGSALRPNCFHEVMHAVLLPDLARDFDFEVLDTD